MIQVIELDSFDLVWPIAIIQVIELVSFDLVWPIAIIQVIELVSFDIFRLTDWINSSYWIS